MPVRLMDAQAGGFYAAEVPDRDGADNGSTYTWASMRRTSR